MPTSAYHVLPHEPADRLSGPMRTEVSRRKGKLLAPVVTLEIQSGFRRITTLAGHGVIGTGLFEPRAKIIGARQRSVGTRTNSLGSSTVSLVVVETDKDPWFTKLLVTEELRGVRAVFQIASPRVRIDDWHTYFVGEIGTWELEEPGAYRIECRTRDLTMKAAWPKDVVTAGAWPHAHVDALNHLHPYVFGIHSSGAASGLVPTLLIDKLTHLYGWTVGRGRTVRAAYKDGVKLTASDWTSAYTKDGDGRIWSTITVPSATDASSITLDTEGLTDRGDGTGVRPSATRCLEIILDNFLFGSWLDGDWLYGTAPLDRDLLWDAQVSIDVNGGEPARAYFAEELSGNAVVEEFCATFKLRPMWTANGEIGMVPLSALVANLYRDRPWIRPPHVREFYLSQQADQVTDRITGSYFFDAAGGSALAKLAVEDLDVEEDAASSVDHRWASSRDL